MAGADKSKGFLRLPAAFYGLAVLLDLGAGVWGLSIGSLTIAGTYGSQPLALP